VIDAIISLMGFVGEFFSTHPAVGSVVFGWVVGISATQIAKRNFPTDWKPSTVKRVSQLVATLSAGIFAWRIWPTAQPLGIEFAVLAGMSCPMVYTFIKVALPQMTRGWGWDAVCWDRMFK
jgi:hypothetical protein